MDNGDLKRSPSPLRGFKYFAACNYYRRPYLVNLEVTKHCNARCDFCACWQVGSPDELGDYAPVAMKLRPVVLSINGGEPLVRRDICGILKGVRPYCHYLVMITNGALLSEELADELSLCGLNQLAVSLDYLDETHDRIRSVTGLFAKISSLVPRLASKGYKIAINTIIMASNLDHILPLVHTAGSWGARISFSTYCPLKRGDDEEMIVGEAVKKLADVVAELKALKRTLGNISNSDYYLDRIPLYFKKGRFPNCRAGRNWVQVSPDGFVQPCSEMPRACRYDEYERAKMPKVGCTKCWYTCRGEAEAPHLAPDRLMELIRA